MAPHVVTDSGFNDFVFPHPHEKTGDPGEKSSIFVTRRVIRVKRDAVQMNDIAHETDNAHSGLTFTRRLFPVRTVKPYFCLRPD
jgi:hypothetical protein